MSLIAILAQAPAGATPQQPPVWTSLVPIGLMFVALYFVLIRPQSKKAKEHAALLKTVRPGDKIITSGGVLGTVVAVKDKSISIRSADTKLEILKSAVSEISERGGESASES